MVLHGAAARAAYYGPRAWRLNLAGDGAEHVTVKSLDIVDGMVRRVLGIKATPKVYTGIVSDLESWLASAWDETRPEVQATARELADLADTAATDPRWKEKARRRLDRLQTSLEKAGADFNANPTEAATLGRYMAAAASLGRNEIAVPMGWSAGFDLPDQDAIHGLTNAGMFWIGDAYGSRLDTDKLLGIVDKVAIQQGLGRKEAGDALAAAFGDEHGKSRVYWQGLAATVATRARSFGAVGAMASAGATVYEYVNPLDERTSDVCRRLDGTRFSVKGAVQLRDRCLEAKSPEEWKAISPWPKLRDLEDGSGGLLTSQELQAKGIAWPPLHFHCRSSIDVVMWTPIGASDADPLGDVDATTPKPPPKPRAPRAPKGTPAIERHQVILHQLTGGAKGSNKGGFYTGSDGVNRYVKFYDDPTQAAGEHLANRLYRDLGLGAPKSELFRLPDGKIAYASEILENNGTLEAAFSGMSEAQRKAAALRALDGFAADVLTANWDAAGLSMDNMVILPDGSIARIDQGAAFLTRAQGARKPAAALVEMSEWWKYLDGTNPGYARIAKAAGVEQAVEIPGLEDQIRRIAELRKKAGSWERYLAAETEISDSDKGAIAALLDDRLERLEIKRSALADIRRIGEMDKGFQRYESRTKAWGNDTLIPKRGKMTAAQKKALKHYTTGAYSDINHALRTGSRATAEDHLRQSVISRSTMPEDVVVWRGIHSCAPLTDLVKGAAQSEGSINLDRGFRSVTIARGVADSFKGGSRDAILFRILLRKGTNGAWVEDFTDNGTEQEIILGMGSRLRVLSSKRDASGVWQVNAVIDPIQPGDIPVDPLPG